MVATYESKTARSMLWVEALLRVEEEAMVTAAGLAPRVGVAMYAAASSTTADTTEDDIAKQARRENIMARITEYGGLHELNFNARDHCRAHVEKHKSQSRMRQDCHL